MGQEKEKQPCGFHKDPPGTQYRKDEDNDSHEDRSQFYPCRNAGCEGVSPFKAAAESWFRQRGLNLPSNCFTCKEWMAEQKEIGPIMAKCQYCGVQWPVQATYRIHYHRNVGIWEDYWEMNQDAQMCRLCRENPHRRLKLRIRNAERRAKGVGEKQRLRYQKEKHERFCRNLDGSPQGRNVQRIDVPSALIYYKNIPTKPGREEEHGPNQLTHILKPEHGWRDKFGTEDPDTILNLASGIARSCESHIRQYTQEDGKVIKYDMRQNIVVILLQEETTSKWRIETSFPGDPNTIKNKIEKGRWA